MRVVFLLLRLLAISFQKVFYVLTFGNLPPFATAAVVVQKEGKVLMIDRSDGKGLGLPGGFVKLNETSEEAAIRETREETGYEIELTGILGVLSGKRHGTWIRSVDVVYTGRVIGGTMKNSFEGHCRWVDAKEEKESLAFDYGQLLQKHGRNKYGIPSTGQEKV